MSLLQSYVDAMREGDAQRAAALFSEDALFHDEAPRAVGMDPLVAKGREAIQELFSRLVANGGLRIESVCICRNAMRYDVVVTEEMVVKTLGVATEEGGLITEYQVRAVM